MRAARAAKAILRLSLLGSVAVILASCVTPSARRQFDAFPLLPPAALGIEANRMQRLVIGRIGGGQTITLDAAVEVDSGELRVAGIFLGRRVLLLAWDGKHLTELRDSVVPVSLKGRAILRDLQMIYWPAEAIRANMPPGCQLEEDMQERRVSCDGKSVLESRRSDQTLLGSARLLNHLGHYMIAIEAAP